MDPEFPKRRFVINVKSKDPEEGKMLAGFLSRLTSERRAQLIVSGDSAALSPLKKKLPDIRLLEKQTLITCIPSYFALGWSGFVPTSCHQTVLLVPINVAPWLWGWPYRFLDRMNKAGTEVFLAGPYHGGVFSTGIDTPKEFKRVPKPYSGGIWTNDIETIAGLIHPQK